MNPLEREIELALKDISLAEEKGTAEFIALVDNLREKVVLSLLDENGLTPVTLQRIKNKLNSIMEDYRDKFEKNLSTNQRRMFTRGIALIDRAIKTQDAIRTVPYLSEATLNQVKIYGADLITALNNDTRSKITNEMNLAVLGQKNMSDVVAGIGHRLKSASVFGTIGRRAEIIYRTELNRIQSLASYERMLQYKATFPNLRKQWIHSHKGEPRLGHLALDKEIVSVDETFTLRGKDGVKYEVSMPYDPTLPASETINCRCKIIPVF